MKPNPLEKAALSIMALLGPRPSSLQLTKLKLEQILTHITQKQVLRVGEGGYWKPLQEPRTECASQQNTAATRKLAVRKQAQVFAEVAAGRGLLFLLNFIPGKNNPTGISAKHLGSAASMCRRQASSVSAAAFFMRTPEHSHYSTERN